MPVLSDETILAEFDDTTGALVRLADIERGIEFLDSGQRSVPFRTVSEVDFSDRFNSFTCSEAQPGALAFRWSVDDSIVISATAALVQRNHHPGVEFFVQVDVGPDVRVDAVEYPVLGTLTRIAEASAEDELAHSYATGFLVRDPLESFTVPGSGFRFMPYPEGFSGATAQLMAYYAAGRGGLLFSCLDSAFAPKWLNFFKGQNDLLEASIMHGNEQMAPGVSFSTTYPTRIELLVRGTWYEAASRYKAWATEQAWCSKGWAVDRPSESGIRRLCDTAGASTFGLDARYDRSRWIRRYQESTRTRMLHVLGPDWTRIPRGYGSRVAPGEIDEWFPAQFSPNNLTTIRKGGDLVTPFEFDYLFPPDKAHDKPEIHSAFQSIPEPNLSHGSYGFPFLCPTEAYTRQLHVERDARLVEEEDVDGVYYDISANNILRLCVKDDHSHPPGGAAALTRAYRENYHNTRKAIVERVGKDPLMGTEMINEVFLDLIDFYQARAGAQPAAAFEGAPLRELIKSGSAELIPLFAFLYHEYGAVRLDGWGKLTKEVGELFYYNASRIYLWGGLFEINAEFSPSEVVDGAENSPQEHYASIVPRGYAFEEDRAAFVGTWASLRLGAGRDFLVYGEMLEPPKFNVDRGAQNVTLDWFSYNCPEPWREYEDSGELTVPSVVVAAWRARDGRIAWFACNVAKESVSVSFHLIPARHGWPDDASWLARRVPATGSVDDTPFFAARGQARVSVDLYPRVPIMILFDIVEEETP